MRFNGWSSLVGVCALSSLQCFDGVGRWGEGHLACTKPAPISPKVLFWETEPNLEYPWKRMLSTWKTLLALDLDLDMDPDYPHILTGCFLSKYSPNFMKFKKKLLSNRANRQKNYTKSGNYRYPTVPLQWRPNMGQGCVINTHCAHALYINSLFHFSASP